MEAVNMRAARALRRVLARWSGGQFEVGVLEAPGREVVTVEYGKSLSRLVPVWAGEGFPRDVEQALDSAARMAIGRHERIVVVARRISAGARERLERDRTNWADETGRALIRAEPGLLVVLESSKATAERQDEVFRWTEGAAAIAEFILLDHVDRRRHDLTNRLPPSIDVAAGVGVSPSYVSAVLSGFDMQGWTQKIGAARGSFGHRVMIEPTAMLSGWASWYGAQSPPMVGAHITSRPSDDFIRDRIFDQWPEGAWAITGWLALERVAPYVTSVPMLDIYVADSVFDDEKRLERLIASSGMRRVDRGARVNIVRADPYVLGQAHDVELLPQVSDIRLYGDLLRLGVRGPDAAEHLRETRIGF